MNPTGYSGDIDVKKKSEAFQVVALLLSSSDQTSVEERMSCFLRTLLGPS